MHHIYISSLNARIYYTKITHIGNSFIKNQIDQVDPFLRLIVHNKSSIIYDQ